jgi:hypothetical protein
LKLPKKPSFKERYIDNPNPDAKIGFVVFYPFHFFVVKNIFKHLENKAEFIIDLGAFYPIKQPVDLLEKILEVLEKNKVFFRILYHDDYLYSHYLEKFFEKYEVLVSPWLRGSLSLACNIPRKKVGLNYGAGKALNTFRARQINWQMHLSFGEYDHRLLKFFTESRIVGNPKFDDWFKNTMDMETVSMIRSKLCPEKKNILYLPTHTELSSIDRLSGQLKKISSYYNIIVKLHYFTVNEETYRIRRLQAKNIILLKDDVDLLPLLKISDIVISDNSSAIFDAILADKPVIATDFLEREFFDIVHKKLKFYRTGAMPPATYYGSIEQAIKKEKRVITIKKPKELKSAIELAFEDPPFFRKERKKIRDELFLFQDGNCGKRAADAINELFLAERLPERSILYHTLRRSEYSSSKQSFLSHTENQEKLLLYENSTINKIIEEKNRGLNFCVIVFDQQGRGEYLEKCFRSLAEQKFPKDKFEVLIISSRNREEVEKFIYAAGRKAKNLPRVCIKEKKDTAKIFNIVRESVKSTQADHICFTLGDNLLPADWLINYCLAYQKYPGVGGVGGYVSCIFQNITKYNEYNHFFDLGKPLGIWRERNYLSELYELKNDVFLQNPAGKLENMSYRKEILLEALERPFNIENTDLFGMEIKKKIMKNYELAFMPLPVYQQNKIDRKNFSEKCFSMGLNSYIFCKNNPDYKQLYKLSFFSPFNFFIQAIFEGHQKTSFPFTVLLGKFYEWLGWVYGYSLIKLKNFKNE